MSSDYKLSSTMRKQRESTCLYLQRQLEKHVTTMDSQTLIPNYLLVGKELKASTHIHICLHTLIISIPQKSETFL